MITRRMQIDASTVTEDITRGAEYLDRQAAVAPTPGIQARKTAAAVGARAYVDHLQSATADGSLTRIDIAAGKVLAHAAHMDGWLSTTAMGHDDKRAARHLVDTGFFRLEPLPRESRARYVLAAPHSTQADGGETSSPREIAQLAHGHPTTAQPAAPAVTTATPTTARDHSPQIG